MPTFTYEAIRDTGARVSGTLTAENQQVALRMLAEQALHPLDVSRTGASAAGGRRKKVKLRYLTTFYQQLADLLRAGVPMMRSLEVLSTQEGGSAVLRQVAKEVREDVVGGAPLAEGLGKHPQIFNELQCSMIRAGERGGFLEDVLARLAVFAEKQDELVSRLKGAMIYPAILALGGAGLVIMIMTVVVPRLRGFLKEESYNVMTHIVFGGCDFLMSYYGLLIGTVIVTVIGFRAFKGTEYGRRTIANAKLKAPVIGKLITAVAVSRFCRILGTLLQNGVPILQSLKIAKDSAGNEVLAEQIERAGESVRRGETLSQPLSESGLFPADILSMIAVAEESNNLEDVLIQIAETHETRTARTIDLAVRMVEPLLLVLMAVMVGGIAFALLVPILTGATM